MIPNSKTSKNQLFSLTNSSNFNKTSTKNLTNNLNFNTNKLLQSYSKLQTSNQKHSHNNTLNKFESLIKDQNYSNKFYHITSKTEIIKNTYEKFYGYTLDSKLNIVISKFNVSDNYSDIVLTQKIEKIIELIEKNIILVENIWLVVENNHSNNNNNNLIVNNMSTVGNTSSICSNSIYILISEFSREVYFHNFSIYNLEMYKNMLRHQCSTQEDIFHRKLVLLYQLVISLDKITEELSLSPSFIYVSEDNEVFISPNSFFVKDSTAPEMLRYCEEKMFQLSDSNYNNNVVYDKRGKEEKERKDYSFSFVNSNFQSSNFNNNNINSNNNESACVKRSFFDLSYKGANQKSQQAWQVGCLISFLFFDFSIDNFINGVDAYKETCYYYYSYYKLLLSNFKSNKKSNSVNTMSNYINNMNYRNSNITETDNENQQQQSSNNQDSFLLNNQQALVEIPNSISLAIEKMRRIIEFLGVPSVESLPYISDFYSFDKLFSNYSFPLINSLISVSSSNIFEQEVFCLMRNCLEFDPDKRLEMNLMRNTIIKINDLFGYENTNYGKKGVKHLAKIGSLDYLSKSNIEKGNYNHYNNISALHNSENYNNTNRNNKSINEYEDLNTETNQSEIKTVKDRYQSKNISSNCNNRYNNNYASVSESKSFNKNGYDDSYLNSKTKEAIEKANLTFSIERYKQINKKIDNLTGKYSNKDEDDLIYKQYYGINYLNSMNNENNSVNPNEKDIEDKDTNNPSTSQEFKQFENLKQNNMKFAESQSGLIDNYNSKPQFIGNKQTNKESENIQGYHINNEAEKLTNNQNKHNNNYNIYHKNKDDKKDNIIVCTSVQYKNLEQEPNYAYNNISNSKAYYNDFNDNNQNDFNNSDKKDTEKDCNSLYKQSNEKDNHQIKNIEFNLNENIYPNNLTSINNINNNKADNKKFNCNELKPDIEEHKLKDILFELNSTSKEINQLENYYNNNQKHLSKFNTKYSNNNNVENSVKNNHTLILNSSPSKSDFDFTSKVNSFLNTDLNTRLNTGKYNDTNKIRNTNPINNTSSSYNYNYGSNNKISDDDFLKYTKKSLNNNNNNMYSSNTNNNSNSEIIYKNTKNADVSTQSKFNNNKNVSAYKETDNQYKLLFNDLDSVGLEIQSLQKK